MASKKRISPVQLAAQIYGCGVEELLSYREYEDGSVVIIAPSGQKFAYSADSIMQFMLREESPRAMSSIAAPLDKGGVESPRAMSSIAAPSDKEGAEAGLPLFGNGGMVSAEAEPALVSDRASQATRTVRGAAKKPRKPSATGKSSG